MCWLFCLCEDFVCEQLLFVETNQWEAPQMEVALAMRGEGLVCVCVSQFIVTTSVSTPPALLYCSTYTHKHTPDLFNFLFSRL